MNEPSTRYAVETIRITAMTTGSRIVLIFVPSIFLPRFLNRGVAARNETMSRTAYERRL